MWTYPPRRILVPVDFGDASARALRTAATVVARHAAAVLVVHAETLEAPPYFSQARLRAFERQRAAAREDAARYLEAFVASHFGGPAETAVVTGPPAEVIAPFARKVDLIIMGTHGKRGPVRWWVGSVAERVVREARVPVLVVRATGSTGAAMFKRIAIVDAGDDFAGSALRYAGGLGELGDGEVVQETAPSIEAAVQDEATLIVVPTPSGGAAFSAGASQLLRRCRRPVLFVPPV